MEVGGEEGFEGEVLRGGREVDGRLEAELTADIGVGEVLERATHRAAAHYEVRDATGRDVRDDVADNAHLREPVARTEDEDALRRIGEQRREFRARTPQGGRVELVGLAGHLRETVEVPFLGKGRRDVQPERFEIVPDRGEVRDLRGGPGLIAGRAQTVLFGAAHVAEEVFPQATDRLAGRRTGPGCDGDGRQMRGHLGAFVRIVVEEDDGLDAEVQLAAEFEDASRLGTPCHLARREGVVLQRHVRAHERKDRIVLGDERQRDAFGAELEESALEIEIGRDGVLAVFGDDAVPERVVRIDREHLLRRGDELPGELVHDRANAVQRIGHGRERAHAFVVEARHFVREHRVVRGHVIDDIGIEAVKA